MIAPPISVLFPSLRFLGIWLVSAILLIIVLLPTPSGFPATNGGILCTTAASAIWATDCLRRVRQWDASTLVPGYATTIWAVAIGIVWCATALATTISSMAGNTNPAFGVATLAGTVLVVSLTFLRKARAWQFGINSVPILALAALIADHRLVIPWEPMAMPASQAAALVLAILAAAVLRRRLGRPTRPETDRALPWRYFHPHVAGPKVLLGLGQPPMRIVEVVMLAITVSIAIQAYRPFDYPTGLGVPVVGLILFLASLTPLMLLKVASAWLPTAWQLGVGDSRRHLGRSFASRVVAMTLAAFGLATVIVVIQALLGGQIPSRPGLEDQFDEALLLCAMCLVVFIVACGARPTRTAKQPSQFGSLGLACAAFLFVSFSAPSFGPVGRMVLLSVVAASAVLAVYAGGRLVARFDFLPTNEE
ncbi:MAG: hypothetical protein OXH15_08620 [Gammaproteobacteria bacterium]|nr:hypothetical protein [Gammaproteobacteria bacterium]